MDEITEAVETIESAEQRANETAGEIISDAYDTADSVTTEAQETAQKVLDKAADSARWTEHAGEHAALDARIVALEARFQTPEPPPVIVEIASEPEPEPPAPEPVADEPSKEPPPEDAIKPSKRSGHFWYR